ncbi:MAG: radical SAM protein [Candidatus Omnitrophica bacterium]|nr:radical SAM protein [Candidatus Omnitrophota bacterium]
MNSEGAFRGCQYGAGAFCTRTHGKARAIRLTRVVADFEEYLRGGASFIVYADEDFLPNDPMGLDNFMDRIERVKEKYRNDYFLEHGIEPDDMSFYIAVRARAIYRKGDDAGNALRIKMLERLKGVGLVKIFLGVESGSPVQLKKTYNKEADLDEMKKAIDIIRGLGIQVVTGFITFDPSVTLGELRDDIKFAREMGLVHGDPITEPINPFKHFRAQTGSALVRRYTDIGLISSDTNPDTLMHDLVYRSDHIRMVMDIGKKWDDMISVMEYSLKGVVWHAEQSADEMERAKLFIDLFNWMRERGYVLLEESCQALSGNIPDRNAKIDKFFDTLAGLPPDKILFELRRSIFPHTDVYADIKAYAAKHGFDSVEMTAFLKSFFKVAIPADWDFDKTPPDIYRGWIADIGEDMALRMLSGEEKNKISVSLNAVFKVALTERVNRLKSFMDSGWESYYSASPDAVDRGMKFRELLKKVIEEHDGALRAAGGPADILPGETLPEFKIYYRTSLKEYFLYRHPDLAKPLGVLIKLVDLLKDKDVPMSLNGIFLYPDGSLRCVGQGKEEGADKTNMLRDALHQIFLSSYDPFNTANMADSRAFLSLLEKIDMESVSFDVLRSELAVLRSMYAQLHVERTAGGLGIEYTDETTENYCIAQTSPAEKAGITSTLPINGKNIPAKMNLYVPGNMYKTGSNGLPVMTEKIASEVTTLVKHILESHKNNGIEGHKKAMMIVNGLLGLMLTLDDETHGGWLDPVSEAVDEAVRPLTVYLPDTNSGEELAMKSPDVNFIFVNSVLHEKMWPGIRPHLEDIITLATPGILDDFPKMLAMMKEGKLRPDIAQLVYELFHNRVNLDAFVRNENFDEVIKFTTNEMRVMPRKTPVLVMSKDNPLLREFASTQMPDFVHRSDGKIRFLLHPYTYKKWKEASVEFPRPGTLMEWALVYPTSSHRTLFVLGEDREHRLIGKAHSVIWAGPAKRQLRPNSVDHTFRVSEKIRQSIDRGQLPPDIKDKFAYFQEQGFTFNDPVLYEEGIGVIYRSLNPYPYVKGEEERFIIPTFAFHNNSINVPDNDAETPLTQLINWNTKDTGEDPAEYFTREVVKPLYGMLFYYLFQQGILLEPHGQNFYVEVDKNGKICRLVIKDWQSTMVNLDRRLQLGLSASRTSFVKHIMGDEASESTSLSVVFDHYWGNYLMRQILETLVERYHGRMNKVAFRQSLLNHFKDAFEELYKAYPESQAEISDVSLRHAKKPQTDRSNTVLFTASGAPLLRPTEYERKIKQLEAMPALMHGRVVVHVSKITDSTTPIEKQQNIPDEMLIDFDRVRVFARSGQTWRDAGDFPAGANVTDKEFIAIYPENYDPNKKYEILIALHGKASHPASIMDIAQKLDRKNAIVIIPRAPYRFGAGYTWFNENTPEEAEMKARSVSFIGEIVQYFRVRGEVNGRVSLLGVSEGGYLAQLAGMRMPEKIKEIISVNAPFREDYFSSEELASVGSGGKYPDILILQYTNDRVVNVANAQRAAAFYRGKGLEPFSKFYTQGAHNKVNIEMAADIVDWLDTRGAKTEGTNTKPDLAGALKNALAVTKMAEEAVPVLLLALSKEDNPKNRLFRERLDLITSAICYCRFQAELGLKERVKETGMIRPESVKWFDVDTTDWLESEVKSLLREVMESNESLRTDNGLSTEIKYYDKNEELLRNVISANEQITLVRVPIEILETIEASCAKEFLNALQQAPNVYVELYSAGGTVDTVLARARYAIPEKHLPDGFRLSKQNTITLFIAPGEEFTSGDLVSSLGKIGVKYSNTIISPVRLSQDPTGLVKGVLMGFRLLSIARHKEGQGAIDEKFVGETIEAYRALCMGYGIENFNLKNEDIIDLALGDINHVTKALRKITKLLPATKYDAADIAKAYARAKTLIIAA